MTGECRECGADVPIKDGVVIIHKRWVVGFGGRGSSNRHVHCVGSGRPPVPLFTETAGDEANRIAAFDLRENKREHD